MTVNDTMLHAFQDDLPFGGVDHRDIGHYHGHEGFLVFSKLRPVFRQPGLNAMGMPEPPCPAWLTKAFSVLVRSKN